MFRMTVKTLGVALAAGLALGACGEEDEGGGGTSEFDNQPTKEAGLAAASASVELKAVTGNDDDSKNKVNSAANGIQRFVDTYRSQKLIAEAGGGSAVPQELGVAAQGQEAGGTLTFENNHLQANFSHHGPSAAGGEVIYQYVADIHMVPSEDQSTTTLDGTFEIDFVFKTLQYDIEYELNAKYDGLRLATACTTGAANAGSLAVDYRLTVGGEAFSQLPAEQQQAVKDQAGGAGRVVATYAEDCSVTVEGT